MASSGYSLVSNHSDLGNTRLIYEPSEDRVYYFKLRAGSVYDVYTWDFSDPPARVGDGSVDFIGISAIQHGLCWFKGHLYALTYELRGDPDYFTTIVYKYDGGWSPVMEAAEGASGPSMLILACDDGQMFVYGNSPSVFKRTTDGSSWSDVSLPSGATPMRMTGRHQYCAYDNSEVLAFNTAQSASGKAYRYASGWVLLNTDADRVHTGVAQGRVWRKTTSPHQLVTSGSWTADGSLFAYTSLGEGVYHFAGRAFLRSASNFAEVNDDCDGYNEDTWDDSPSGTPGIPIYRSGDGGESHYVYVFTTTPACYIRNVAWSELGGGSGGTPGDEARGMGLAADADYVCLTYHDDTSLRLAVYSPDLGTLHRDVELGEATKEEVEARTYRIEPVLYDGTLYVFGRTGDDEQVLVSNDYGETFEDISDSGWAGKRCAALLPGAPPYDLVAILDDDEVYAFVLEEWVNTGTAPMAVRCAARHPVSDEILVGADSDGADVVKYTPNLGATWADASGGLPTTGGVNRLVMA